MKDIVVISIYDTAIDLSVLIDGKVYEANDRYEREKSGERNVADELDEIYAKSNWQSGKYKKAFKKKFPNKWVILCENGDIEVL